MNRPAPLATYRLQLHAGFDFDAAGAIAGYLHALGISHVYTSPYLQAAKGSMHGYDVVDHSRVNEELGGAAAHERFCQTLGRHQLGQVLDIVPNHMAITGPENAWWWDVLENGPASPYASYFDVEWHPPEEKLRNKVLAPILGEHYGRVLKDGQIKLARHGGGFEFRYFDHVLPAAPRSMSEVLAEAAREANSEDLGFLASSLARLPAPTITDRARLLERHRDKQVIRGLLTRLCQERREVCEAIDRGVARVNENVDRLDELLERQNYRVSFWKTAGRELGHRRFFDVNTLVGLRIESQQVFDDTHRLLIDWLDRGVVDGLRIDHPDGLLDPRQYFERLARAAPKAWIVCEKILEPGETLPEDWPVAGTTGYDFLNVLNGLFVDSSGEAPATEFYGEFTEQPVEYAEVAHANKLLVERDVLGSDVNRLTALFMQICESDRDHRDYTRHDIHHAVREVVACFPVYRTYVRADYGEVTATDIRYIDAAIAAARVRRPDLDAELFDFLRRVLTLESRSAPEAEFVLRFQQFTGPAMAKGVEDTTFYAYNRLTSLNEVGGDPGRFGVEVAEFHRFCGELQRLHPETMVCTSTHDTKRSEDVRARISLLSEIPGEWRDAACRWSVAIERYREDGLPDRNTEYLLYQTLAGAWPITPERLKAYMLKACREAKQHTSWLNPNEQFEKVLNRFIDAIFADKEFVADVERFTNRLIGPGRTNSLAQVLLKTTAPGVPDMYQGTELWDGSLVDPDNRRPVDYALRERLLAELGGLSAEKIQRRSEEGLPKLWTVHQALLLRRERPESFGKSGAYTAMEATGEKAEHVVAFRRGEDVVTVAPRLPLKLGGNWGDTRVELPAGHWRNRLTGDMVNGGDARLGDLLARFPVALLVKERGA